MDLGKLREMNELDHLVMCPRCGDAVPVFIRTVTRVDRFGESTTKEIHCLKCHHFGHKDGTFIKEI